MTESTTTAKEVLQELVDNFNKSIVEKARTK